MCAHNNSNSLAQASIETLLVFLIFLSAFGIVYAASSRLASAAQARLDISLSQASFSEFAGNLKSACSLGNGNVREAEINGKAAVLTSPSSNSIVFSAGNFTATAASACEILLADGAPARSFRIENRNGTLVIN